MPGFTHTKRPPLVQRLLVRLYVEEKLSIEQVAGRLRIGRTTVERGLIQDGVTRRTRKEAMQIFYERRENQNAKNKRA